MQSLSTHAWTVGSPCVTMSASAAMPGSILGSTHRRSLATALALSIVATAAATPPELAPTAVATSPRITQVTLYPDAAQVVREATLPEGQGTFELRFAGLPEVGADAISARAKGARVLEVRFEERVLERDAETSAELASASAALDRAKRGAERLALELVGLDDQARLLDAIAARAAGEAGRDFGSKALDPEALARQVEFVAASRRTLVDGRLAHAERARANADELKALEAKVRALGGRSRVERVAIVTVGKAQPGVGTVLLTTLVDGPSWTPRYSIRALDSGDDAGDRIEIEYEASVSQVTGEDWNDVELVLSTAQPSTRPHPPSIDPVFLSVVPPAGSRGEADKAMAEGRPTGPGGVGGGFGGGGFGSGLATGGIIGDAGEDPERLGVELARVYADSEAEGGAIASFPIRRRVTIPSDGSKSWTQRIATIELVPEFRYVTAPMSDAGVFLRGKARNTSEYRLLEGEARIFLGDAAVGTIDLPTISPGVEAEFWFGADPRIECRRARTSDETREEGVFGKSVVRISKWRVELSSTLPYACVVELEDRIPVSRDERVKVELRDLSRPLSTGRDYLDWRRPDGILLWDVPLAASAGGKPVVDVTTWTLRQSWPVGIEVRESDEDPAER